MTTSPSRRHILTICLEDYFQVSAFSRLIRRSHWSRFERRVEQGTDRALRLLAERRVNATFFVPGWIAEKLPELVRRVSEAGHEIASQGYDHRRVQSLPPGEFRDDLARTAEAIGRATGRTVAGYRLPDGWLEPADLWILDELVRAGYRYDSSLAPLGLQWSGEPWRRYPHVHSWGGRSLVEFPISSTSLLGFHLPFGGGNYWRQLPIAWIRNRIERWHRTRSAPLVLYAHTWEFDPDQPRISAAPLHARIRHYRNLDRMLDLLEWCLTRYPFAGVSEYLNLGPEAVPAPVSRPASPHRAAVPRPSAVRAAPRKPVTIVVPCFNEELIVPYLANTLRSLDGTLGAGYDLSYVFVDDGSTDGTWAALQETFGARPRCRLIRHPENRGIAAAIMTGMGEAFSEIVCSIDCDCTYDPRALARMIPLLTDGVAVVTASPYHPDGAVRNVPGWRLALSKTLSRLYRLVLGEPLHTFTACFRVYRRSAVRELPLVRQDFLGISELLGRVILDGRGVVEYPATLEVRLLGRSKLKVLRTIAGHCLLLAMLASLRLTARRAARDPLGEPVRV